MQNLKKMQKFLQHTTVITMSPDTVLLSEFTRHVIMLEPTLPCKRCLNEVIERKPAKCEGLVSMCRQVKCSARCYSTEVSCRVFAAQSLVRTLGMLAIEVWWKRRAIIPPVLQRAPWGKVTCYHLLRVYDFEMPETPSDSRNIT